MILESVELQVKSSVGCRDCIWVVPFEILRHTVPDVYRLEVWIIASIESSPIGIKFIRKLGMLVRSSSVAIIPLTTRVNFSPSFEVFEYAVFGVSGSISPVLTFFSKGILSDRQFGFAAQVFGFAASMTCRPKVLRAVSSAFHVKNAENHTRLDIR